MVIFITGATHTGKTNLAQRMLEKLKYPYVSQDHIKMGLIRSHYTELTPDDDDQMTDYLWPITREMAKTAIENNQNLIIEGCYIPFAWKKDFNEMYLSGIDVAVTCAYYPYKIDNDTILLNHLMRILNYDTKRAGEHGIELKVALGIHPTNTNVDGGLIYENLYKWIENKDIVAIGEIGLENLTEKEYEIFKKK